MAKGFDDYKVGSWVEVSSNSRGMLSDFKWTDGSQTFKAKVVGFDSSGYPVLYFPNTPTNIGAWSVNTDSQKKDLGIDNSFISEIPLGKNCLYAVFEPNALKKYAEPKVETMKYNLSVGDRVVVGQEKNQSDLSKYGWSDTALTYSATVVGQKADGTPFLYFDSVNAPFMFSWQYNYGTDQSMLDEKFAKNFNSYDKKFAQLTSNISFIKEADYKNGKRISLTAMPLETLLNKNNIATNFDPKVVDTKDFIRNIGACLTTDETESHLFGEQFTALFTNETPRKHDVFVKTKQGSAKIANNIRNQFSDSNVVYSGPVDSVNEDLITEEYLVKWRNADMTKQYKVHVSYPKNPEVKSAFEKGGVDANSFQMFRKDLLVKNFANEDVLTAVKNVINKNFTTFGSAAAATAIVGSLVNQGFVSKEKTKEKKKMATKNDLNDASEKTFMEMMVSDFHEAKFRVAADQTTHLIKEGMVKALNAKGGDSAQAEILKMMLDSDGGEAAIAWLAGIGLTYGPGISNHPQAKRFAKEFRVNGQAKAGNLIAETIMGSLIPILANALTQLPSEEMLRVAETSTETRVNAVTDEDDEEEHETKSEAKKAVA